MRSLLTLLAALFFTTIHSQNYRYYRPGQKISDPQNACLVFSEKQKKNHTAKSLAEYRPVKAIKFSGYQSDNSVFDSLLSLTMRNLDPETVIFENCDLSTLTVPLAGYRSLANLSALKNCSFMEGDLYALLKTSGVKRLRLQVQEGDFESDSLYHLPDLEKIEISNTPNFNKANKTRQVQLVRNGNLQTVSIGFYGSLYQNEKDEVSLQRTVMPNSENQALNKEFKSLAYDWLKAPLPGVKINDTVYNYFPGRRNSFAYYSGSSISIDADAFVYQDGNKYSGPVQINYREFRDPVEIMLSGIPMTVAVNGETRLLTSGGMYEISALDEKGNELMTKSDTAIKVNFALSDTSSSFGFYTMDKNGNWDLTDQKVISVPKALSDTISGESMAVRVYRDYSGRRKQNTSDSTDLESRFWSHDYVYGFRKDNLTSVEQDSTKYYIRGVAFKKIRGFVRIKYLKQTKDKEILFTLVPNTKHYYEIPKHERVLLQQTFVYNGELDRKQFKAKYCKNVGIFDLRGSASGKDMDFTFKTDKEFIKMSASPATLNNKGKVQVAEHSARTLNKRMDRYLTRDNKMLSKEVKKGTRLYNYIKPDFIEIERVAFDSCKRFMNEKEKAMTFKEWETYLGTLNSWSMGNYVPFDNSMRSALMKSGVGFKNIDCLMMPGVVEDVLVKYEKPSSRMGIQETYTTIFPGMNTALGMYGMNGESYMRGYVHKLRRNIIVRFTEDGYMQVSGARDISDARKNNKIQFAYVDQYYVKNMDSKQISKLILH